MKKILFFVFLILISFGLSSCNEEDIIDELDDLKQLSTPEVFISETGLASWDKVKHAEGYAYRINGEKAIETLELEVQLEEGDSIRVKAIGDGEKYKDSKYSDGKIYESKTKEETNPDTQTPPDITPPLEERTITIYFKANGGSGYMSSQKVSIAEDVYLKENKFYRDGYEFIGWALSSSIDYALFVDYIPKSFLEELSVNTVTLYAVWEANSQDYSQPLDIWVGSESAAYYQEVMDEYAKKYNLPFEVRVTGMDTGSAADIFLTDPEAGADIFTVPHDSLGKLLAGSGQIAAIKSEYLLEQIESNNPKSFLNVCYLQAEDGSAAEFYAAPIMSQALVLYYNKEVFKGQEEKLASWEGIMEVAKANNAMATSFQGADGYNYSAFLLAQPYNEAAKAVFGTQGTLQLYRDGVQANCMGYGDDQVAINKWAQRFITNLNGRDSSVMSYNGWYTELASGEAITLVGGSWSLNSVEDALGRNNYGIVELPTFTLTAADAYGKAKAGMTFHSGSYVDAKCLVKKKDSVVSEYLDDIIEYLTSDEIQKRSYEECGNQPASINVELGDNELALAQQAQSKYGIAQPFGYKAKYNTYYYSKGAPDLYVAIHQNTGSEYATDAAILAKLQEASFIWAKGKNPADAAELAAWVASK
jgi:arabinogalactan oligomer/maltooligosaccharide transport system substrate-binding protein